MQSLRPVSPGPRFRLVQTAAGAFKESGEERVLEDEQDALLGGGVMIDNGNYQQILQ
jgi:hypothetical protein